jgi:competence protein ComEC
MKSSQTKPAIKLLIPLIVGILFAWQYKLPPAVLLISLLVASIGALIFRRLNPGKFFAIFAFLAFTLIGALDMELRSDLFPGNHIRYFAEKEEIVSVEGMIDSPVERKAGKYVFDLSADSAWLFFRPFSTTGKLRVSLYDSLGMLSLDYGDRIVIKGRCQIPPGERNPGDFNYQKYLAARDIHAIMSVSGTQNVAIIERRQGSRALQNLIYPLRRFIIQGIDDSIGGQQGALLKGLLVGARSDIGVDLNEAFINAGVVHILAVSGLNVGYILLGLLSLLTLLRCRDPWRSLLAIGGLIFYSYLTGSNPPVVRATIMASVALIAGLVQRPLDVINSIALAAFVILVLNPLELFQVDFQLSFVAVIGMVLLYKKIHSIFAKSFLDWSEREQRYKVYLANLFLVSLAAQLATLPLTAFYFNRVPIISLAANLVVVPWSTLITALGFISSISTAIFQPIGAVYADANWLALTTLIYLVRGAAHLPFSYLFIARPEPLAILIYFLVLGLFVFWSKPVVRKRLVFVLLIAANLLIWRSAPAEQAGLRVTFFDVGQGDAALFEFPGGKTMLVDAGEGNEKLDYGERVIAPYLRREGIRKIDALVISHPHSDHNGGAVHLLANVDVGRIIQIDANCSEPACRKIDSLIQYRKIPSKTIMSGDSLAGFAGTTILVLHPTMEFVEKARRNPAALNDCSSVLKITFGQTNFLMTGDAGIDAEKAMLRFTDALHADVIKVGHHGSSTASSEAFRGKVKPQFAVVSVGRFNRFGLPSEKTMRDWQADGASLARTDENGAIVFFTDGKNIRRMR